MTVLEGGFFMLHHKIICIL